MLALWDFLVFVLNQNFITVCSAMCFEMDPVVFCLACCPSVPLSEQKDHFQPMTTDDFLSCDNRVTPGRIASCASRT